MSVWKTLSAGALAVGATAYLVQPDLSQSQSGSDPRGANTTLVEISRAANPPTSSRAAPLSLSGAGATREAASEQSTRAGRPAVPDGAADLVREIQIALQQAGCYKGPVDGLWGAGTRAGVARLGQHIRADLRTDEPSYILLALARRQPARACPTSHPAQEARTAPMRPRDGGTEGMNSVRQSTPRTSATAPAGSWAPITRPTVAPGHQTPSAVELAQRKLQVRQLQEQRRQAEIAAIEARRLFAGHTATPTAPPAPYPLAVARPVPIEGRMSLGVAAQVLPDVGTPVGVTPAAQPGTPPPAAVPPQSTSSARQRPSPPSARRQASGPAPPIRPTPPPRRAWARSIFTDMSRNGP